MIRPNGVAVSFVLGGRGRPEEAKEFRLRYFLSSILPHMKKLTIPIMAFIAISCQKTESTPPEQKYCWNCTTTVSSNPSYGASPSHAYTTYCDLTPTQISKIQKDGTSTVIASSGGITITQHTTTLCVKQ